jgi:transposase
MTHQDARSLSPEAQEDLRRRVIAAVQTQGMKKAHAARTFGVSRQAINNWLAALETGGDQALAAKQRGRPKATTIASTQQGKIVRAIRGRCPDQLRLPFALWTREAVVALIKQHTGREVSVWTAGRYLRDWGFTPQKPVRRAYEQNPVAVQAWLDSEYPAIHKRAKAENALILWGDEMGLRSDDTVGRTYSPRGETPVVPATGRRFGCNMISAISNLGRLWFMVFSCRFNADVFIRFLSRLLKSTDGRKVILIIDSHPAHKAAKVARWIEATRDRKSSLELCFMPGYSPELNPDELLNQDTKQAMRRRRPRDQSQMMANTRSHLRRRQKQPNIVQNFFQEKHVRYAAQAG